jgi:hypothetical protein
MASTSRIRWAFLIAVMTGVVSVLAVINALGQTRHPIVRVELAPSDFIDDQVKANRQAVEVIRKKLPKTVDVVAGPDAPADVLVQVVAVGTRETGNATIHYNGPYFGSKVDKEREWICRVQLTVAGHVDPVFLEGHGYFADLAAWNVAERLTKWLADNKIGQ